jgi:hypothetical protein
VSLKANSSKFDFDYYGGSPQVVHFLQWVTGENANSNVTVINYLTYTSVYTYSTSYNFSYEIIVFCSNDGLYLTGVKAGVLLVKKVVETAGTAVYSYQAQAGLNFAKTFKYNMGVPYDEFGQPKDGGHCLTGLQTLNLYRNLSYPDASSFEFTFQGS